MLKFAAAAFVLAAATGASAQAVPASSYLLVETAPEYVVLLDVGSRHSTAEGWSALSITIFDMADAGQVRVDTEVVANCRDQTRRTDELVIRTAMDPDNPGAVIIRGAPIAWTPRGPADGPLMSFLCDGSWDTARVQGRVSDQVKIWRAAH